MVRDEPASKKVEEMAAVERERAARVEAERKEKEAKETARLKEEEAQKALAEKELELERERERVVRLESERKEREAEDLARMKGEEEARKALAEKELQAERERMGRLEAERLVREKDIQAVEEAARKARAEEEKRFQESLVAKKYPGVEGEIFESSLLKDIRFDFDRYDIRREDMEILNGSAALLRKRSNVKIQIEGHCDERGTQEYNLALAERRANSAKAYLVSLGVPDNRISTITYGEERPADPNHNEEAWAKNRRAHFVILSK
jgi:peptidoglycan-associated lipoprotein